MKPTFLLNRFAITILGSHIVVYLCWCFIDFSFKTPILETFKDENSRGWYLSFLFCVLFCGLPIYLPFKGKDND